MPRERGVSPLNVEMAAAHRGDTIPSRLLFNASSLKLATRLLHLPNNKPCYILRHNSLRSGSRRFGMDQL
jgi:hypothetical protein